MESFKLKLLMLLIPILLIISFVISFIILFKHNDTNNDISNLDTEQISQNNNVNNTNNYSNSPLIVEMVEEKIYGYDENAMQVQDYYDGHKACGYIEISKTGLSMPILDGQTVSGMEYSCCKLYSTEEFNLSGNSYIVGHNYENGTLFSNNKNLSVGDKIVITRFI